MSESPRTRWPGGVTAATGPSKRKGRTPGAVTYRMEIPGWRPALTNELLRHWRVAARLKKGDMEVVARAMLAFGVPAAKGCRRVRFEITGRYSTFPDPDAPFKSGLDALKRAGAIVDDSAEWCEWEKPVYRRGPKGTVIILEDMEP